MGAVVCIDAYSGIFSVEITRADDFLRLGEDEQIVNRRVDIGWDDFLHKLNGVMRDAVHLSHATDRVRVQHFVAKPVGDGNLRRMQGSP